MNRFENFQNGESTHEEEDSGGKDKGETSGVTDELGESSSSANAAQEETAEKADEVTENKEEMTTATSDDATASTSEEKDANEEIVEQEEEEDGEKPADQTISTEADEQAVEEEQSEKVEGEAASGSSSSMILPWDTNEAHSDMSQPTHPPGRPAQAMPPHFHYDSRQTLTDVQVKDNKVTFVEL